jgi:hypothetical protein
MDPQPSRSSTISPDGRKVKQVLPEFTVVQHRSDIQILHALKAYFQCGVVPRNHVDRESYRVRNRNQLETIILPFFEKHKLKTKKRVQFEKFRDVVLLMNRGEHLTPVGVEKILKIRHSPLFEGSTYLGEMEGEGVSVEEIGVASKRESS